MKLTTLPMTSSMRSRACRLLLRMIIIFTSLMLIAYFGISSVAANILTTPSRKAEIETPSVASLIFQDVRFSARGDDVSIAAWFIPRELSHKAVLLVHGLDGNRSNWFQHNFAGFVPALHNRGFAVLIIDMRGHGQSGNAHFSFGLNERHDIEGGVDWLKSQGFEAGNIGVLGLSMGAAASIGAMADDHDIGALVADSSYASIQPLIQREWSDASGLPDFFLPSTLVMVRLLFGIDLYSSQPVNEMDNISPRPVLIVHTIGDERIPAFHADELKAADANADLWKTSGTGHCTSYINHSEEYIVRVAEFFERTLK